LGGGGGGSCGWIRVVSDITDPVIHEEEDAPVNALAPLDLSPLPALPPTQSDPPVTPRTRSFASDTPSSDCMFLEHLHDRAAYRQHINESEARRAQRAAAAAAAVPLPADGLSFETEDDGNEDWREKSLDELYRADAEAAAARMPDNSLERKQRAAEVAEREKMAEKLRVERAAAADEAVFRRPTKAPHPNASDDILLLRQ
ncbi:hypothetical protein JCM10207_006874, partial [Rhodosporidiobolus poonsookiae]